MGLTIPLSTNGNGNGDEPPVHWPTAKAAVIERLNVIEEYEKLGVKFPNKQRGGKDFCWVACHAFGREDNVASAAVHCDQGIYVDKGGESKAKDFFRFAAEHGPFGSWYAGFKHYADQVGYAVGRVDRGSNGSILESRHEYRDAGGERRYACFRYRLPNGSKRPSLARWDGDRWVREKGCMAGVEPLPYRFPDLLSGYAGRDYILWTEGEADVDRAYDAGFCATTSHMGAGNWRNTGAKFLHLLPAHDYAIVPDNDPDGRAYAAEVADALKGQFGSEATVKVVPLPGVPYGGNVSDWLGIFGTAEELRALIAAAPAWEPGQQVEAPEAPSAPEPEPPKKKVYATLADAVRVIGSTRYVWDPWIPANCMSLLAALPGVGKTRIAMDLARRLWSGDHFPDGTENPFPEGTKTIWVLPDRNWGQTGDVAASFGLPLDAVLLNSLLESPLVTPELDDPRTILDLADQVADFKPGLIVIDTITYATARNTARAEEAKVAFDRIMQLAAESGTAVLALAHLGKSGDVLNRRITERARSVISLSRPDPKGQPDRRKLWVSKTAVKEPRPMGVTFRADGNDFDFDPPEEPEVAATSFSMSGPRPLKRDAAVEWIKDYVSASGVIGRPVRSDVVEQDAKSHGFSRTTFLNAKAVAIEQDLVHEYSSDGHKVMEIGLTKLKVCP